MNYETKGADIRAEWNSSISHSSVSNALNGDGTLNNDVSHRRRQTRFSWGREKKKEALDIIWFMLLLVFYRRRMLDVWRQRIGNEFGKVSNTYPSYSVSRPCWEVRLPNIHLQGPVTSSMTPAGNNERLLPPWRRERAQRSKDENKDIQGPLMQLDSLSLERRSILPSLTPARVAHPWKLELDDRMILRGTV